ncbi:MAG: FAD-binding oxidoreductase [Verrucomicrobiales bacterium]
MAALSNITEASPAGFSRRQINELQEIVGETQVLHHAIDLIPYQQDGTAGLSRRPAAVAIPRTTAQVSALVVWANKHGVPIVPRGSGTGLAGGVVPVGEALMLSLVEMNQVLFCNPASRRLRCQAGVNTQVVAETASSYGLFYPPDPGSMKISTIAGNVACNSGGLRGLKYGVTRDYVVGGTVVLADGSVQEIRATGPRPGGGISALPFLIGSEGTLGILTEIELRLIDPPEHKETVLAVFDKMENAAATVSAIIAHPIVPCTMEFLDGTTIRCVERSAQIGLPPDADALLLLETDGSKARTEEEVLAMERIAKQHGAVEIRRAASLREASELSAARRTAFSALARVRPTTILEDITVPPAALEEMLRRIKSIAEKHKLQVGTFGHFGDGNLHPTFLTDERDDEEMSRIHDALKDLFEQAVELGGTLSGEHGVGLVKRPYLPLLMNPAEQRLQAVIKAVFDPHGRFNPGKAFIDPDNSDLSFQPSPADTLVLAGEEAIS